MPCRLGWHATSHHIWRTRSESIQSFQERAQALLQRALPKHLDGPARAPQSFLSLPITSNVRIELCLPKLPVRSRPVRSATPVPMPETAVNEDRCSIPGQHNVRMTGKASYVKAKAKAGPEQGSTDTQLGFCVPPANLGHIPAALFRVQMIGAASHVRDWFRPRNAFGATPSLKATRACPGEAQGQPPPPFPLILSLDPCLRRGARAARDALAIVG